jgi:hypothetical protein
MKFWLVERVKLKFQSVENVSAAAMLANYEEAIAGQGRSLCGWRIFALRLDRIAAHLKLRGLCARDG